MRLPLLLKIHNSVKPCKVYLFKWKQGLARSLLILKGFLDMVNGIFNFENTNVLRYNDLTMTLL